MVRELLRVPVPPQASLCLRLEQPWAVSIINPLVQGKKQCPKWPCRSPKVIQLVRAGQGLLGLCSEPSNAGEASSCSLVFWEKWSVTERMLVRARGP